VLARPQCQCPSALGLSEPSFSERGSTVPHGIPSLFISKLLISHHLISILKFQAGLDSS
jgi:hypothetical protein